MIHLIEGDTTILEYLVEKARYLDAVMVHSVKNGWNSTVYLSMMAKRG